MVETSSQLTSEFWWKSSTGGWATAVALLLLLVFQLLRSLSRRRPGDQNPLPTFPASPLASPPLGTSKLVTDADLKDLIISLEGATDEGEIWEDVIDKKNEQISYKAKCCRPKVGPLKYLSVTTFEECSTEVLRDFYMDNEYRIEWDKTWVQHEQLQVDETSGTEIGRTIKKFPFLTPREYILAWRVWEGKEKTFYCFTKECEHSRAPRQKKYVRVRLFRSGWYIRKVPGRDACEITVVHQEDAGLNVEMAKLAFAKGIWSYVCKMNSALREYSSRNRSRSTAVIAKLRLIQKVPPALESGSGTSRPVESRFSPSFDRLTRTEQRRSHRSSAAFMEEIAADLPVPVALSGAGSGASSSAPPSTPDRSIAARYDDDDEGDVCRICRNSGDAENPLRYPCACSGSIKYVHQDCLLQWLSHSNNRHCEVCKHAFSFSPVYAKNAPARLPFQEFMVGMAKKACHIFQFIIRLAFVLSVWLLIIPFITFWIWRLSFVRSFGEAQRIILSHISASLVLTDCLHGFLLSASIVFIFLGATSLRDYFRQLRELGGHEVEREDEGHERHGVRAVRRLLGPANRIRPGDGNAEDAGGAQGLAGAGQIIRRNAENVAARLEMQAERLEAHVEQMFDGLDDADGAEDVPFDELVGMQGPVFHLVENAITVLASNGVFIGVVIFLPFSLGRLVLYYLSCLFSSASSPMLSRVMPLTESALSLANITLKNAFTAVMNLSESLEAVAGSSKINATGMDEASNSVSTAVSGDLFNWTIASSSRLSDVTTLGVGYMLIICFLSFYLGLVALIRYSRGQRLTIGRLYGIASIAEAVPALFRQFWAGTRHLMTMVKVAFLLVIELGVFPLMCGWWLDICTLRMLGTTVAKRIEFFSFSPLASSSIHWLVGILYMLQISIFVSLLRGVLRNGVLYFLRDPADPNYNPFRDLIDDPVHKHARRVLLSVAVYGSLIVMLVFLPVKLAMRLAPSVFPLDVTVFDPFTEIPADVLLFQICIPFAIEHFKPRMTIKALLRQWFIAAGCALGLTEFLLPRPEENVGQENRNVEPARRGRLHNAHQGVVQEDDHPQRQVVAARDIVRRVPAIGNTDEVEESDVDDQEDSEYGFVLRIVLLLILAWMTLLLFNSALIVVPVSLGRALFNAIPRLPFTHGIKCNDLFAFSVGCYTIWTFAAGARYSTDYISSGRAGLLVSQIWKWFAIALKSSALLSIWIFVIPVLIGLLFELLVIVPMRVPVDESPVFLLYQDWALGLIFLKIWTRLVMLDHMAPLVDECWRVKFERVREDGFSRLRGLWVLREIVIPIIMKLLTALCIPYAFARGLFPVLGYSLVVNSAVYRFAWLGCLLIAVICFAAKRFLVWFNKLHNAIRDDRYLIGRRLHDFGERTADTNSADAGWIVPEQGGDIGLRLRHVNRHLDEQ